MPNKEIEGFTAKCPECNKHMRPVTTRDIATKTTEYIYTLWECPQCHSGMVHIDGELIGADVAKVEN